MTQNSMSLKWSISIYARNESSNLRKCLRAVASAINGVKKNTKITLILNGTSDDSVSICRSAAHQLGLSVEIYSIKFADKSNALNQFMHSVRPNAETYFFVDGYARVDNLAFSELQRRFDANAHILAATAVPSTGRHALEQRTAMVKEGGLHGSLFALRRSTLEKIIELGLRLPIGLYRGDGLINSFISHNFDARANPWRPLHFGAVVTTATWRTIPLSVWRWRDLARYTRRLVRQARGRFENEAIKEIIYQDGYKALPVYADTMILNWIKKSPEDRMPKLTRDPFGAIAIWQINRHPQRPPPEATIAHLVG